MRYSFLSVDYQKEFASPIGRWYKERPCESFIKKELIPFFSKYSEIKIAEIISDYRLPRPSENLSYCIPGTEGYQSEIPAGIKLDAPWIKAMNSPDWTRKNVGTSLETAEPYQDAKAFRHWLGKTIGEPGSHHQVIVFGLTMDCCVLCTVQQLYFYGYQAVILLEATDVYDPSALKKFINPQMSYKDMLFATTHGMFAKPIRWAELRPRIENAIKISSNSNPAASPPLLCRSRL